ncbi:CMRF35-like molecule 1 [Diretmus argenteus]
MRTSGLYDSFLNAPFLCLLWLITHKVESVQLWAPAVVTAEKGESVTVACQYDPYYRYHTKYWCKGQVYQLCKVVVKTPMNRYSDRSSIDDDTVAGVFTVTMTSLRQSDEDKYWCVIARHGRNVYAGVKLLISHRGNHLSLPKKLPEVWWRTLRWILFILMLFCIASTHIVVWRIHALRGKEPRNEVRKGLRSD